MPELVRGHAAVFLDAYGVLVDADGALPGAREMIAEFNRSNVPYWILTNDASRLPATMVQRFERIGMAIPRHRIVSSGDLIGAHFASREMLGARCVVLGTADSKQCVADAGGVVVEAGGDFDALVVCDEAGFAFLETLDSVLSALIHALDSGRSPHLLLPNPDLIYPKRDRQFGFAAGSVALMLESALALRFPSRPDLRFEKLGKPHAPIFSEACRRAGTRNAVMIGDQLQTDILGANDFGIASALVGWGLTRLEEVAIGSIRPSFFLRSLDLIDDK